MDLNTFNLLITQEEKNKPILYSQSVDFNKEVTFAEKGGAVFTAEQYANNTHPRLHIFRQLFGNTKFKIRMPSESLTKTQVQ